MVATLPADFNETWLDWTSLEGWSWYRTIRAWEHPLPDDMRLQRAWLKAMYVPTARDEMIHTAISRTVERNGGSKRRWLAIDGMSNLGKSESIVNYAIHATPLQGGDVPRSPNGYRHIPVVYIQAGSSAGAGMLAGICDFIGVPAAGNEDKTRALLHKVLPQTKTEVIAVDDGHDVHRVSDTAVKMTNAARNMLRLPATLVVVGAGLEDSAWLRRGAGGGYEAADQLRSRCSLLPLSPMSLPRDQRIFELLIRRFAGGLARAIPGFTFSGLRRGADRRELLTRTRGCHGIVFDVLKDASIRSLELGTRDLTAELLAELWPQAPGEPNLLDWNEHDFLSGQPDSEARVPDGSAGPRASRRLAGDAG